MISAHVVIIGAGPAGLMCAIHCASSGISTLVLEKNHSPGKKLLLTGSGRCNLTHAGAIRDFLGRFGGNDRFVKPALFNFTNEDTRQFFERRNLKVIDSGDGKLFPATNRSSDVLRVLLDECAKLSVVIKFGSRVSAITRTADGFEAVCDSDRPERYGCRNIVIATGGASWPQTGSSGDGYEFARQLGHSIEEVAPALAPVIIKDFAYRSCAGISLEDTPLFIYRAGEKIRESSGDVLFTHTGLSGPGILDLSRYVRTGDVIKITLVKSRERGPLEDELIGEFAKDGKQSLKKCLLRYAVPGRLLLQSLSACGISADMNTASVEKKLRSRIADMLSGLPFVVSKTGDFSEAMVTRGGVSCREINQNTMESRIVRGLYFTGEVMDVDGDTGGYNLQFAFSSGVLAGKGIAGTIL